MNATVLLADDHILVRESLKSLLERAGFQVVGEASDGQEALRLIQASNADIAVLDIGMPVLNGLDAVHAIRKMTARTKTILLTQHDEPQYVAEALDAGVKGYVLKSQVASDLIGALRQVSQGGVYLSPRISSAVM